MVIAILFFNKIRIKPYNTTEKMTESTVLTIIFEKYKLTKIHIITIPKQPIIASSRFFKNIFEKKTFLDRSLE